jgi:hypothetical protein
MIRHNPYASVDMTCLQGYIRATYKELVETFGPPGEGDDYKIDVEWILKWPNGVVATIYNWKDGKNYCGPEGKAVEDILDWNIGGHTSLSVEYVRLELSKLPFEN